MVWMITLLFLSAVCRAVSEIGKFRRDRTWLPPFFTATRGWLNIDGYHIFSAGVWILALCAGLMISDFGFRISDWWVYLLAWFLYGNVFSLFYHVIFTKPGWRDNWILDWFKELFSGQRIRGYLKS